GAEPRQNLRAGRSRLHVGHVKNPNTVQSFSHDSFTLQTVMFAVAVVYRSSRQSARVPHAALRGDILTLQECFENPLLGIDCKAAKARKSVHPLDLCLNWTTDLELDMPHTRPVNLTK